jgi:hypothetical protein
MAIPGDAWLVVQLDELRPDGVLDRNLWAHTAVMWCVFVTPL